MSPFFFFFFFFFFIIIFSISLFPPSLSLNQESLFLLQAKLSLSDPTSALSSWSPRCHSPCSFSGVRCDPSSHAVTSVDLSSSGLTGPFPLSLCRLQNLTFLSFFNNSINGSLPLEISSCKSLQHLDLSQNYLTGSLPNTLPGILNLTYLDLAGNNFSGEIPATFGGFRKLEVISLVYNLLDGVVPAFLGNVSSLKMLNLSYNPFSPSRIPAEFGNLTGLEVLWLTECNLIGEIPDSLGRLKNLKDLDLAVNNLVGGIPSSLTELSGVVQVELYDNSLTGELPRGMGRMAALRLLDASMNRLSGKIPDELCGLQLESLNLYENQFEGTLPASIASSTRLYELRLFRNRLTGALPGNLGENSPLRWLDVSNNEFTGGMPENLCRNGKLEELLMIHNSFSGSIPGQLSGCRSLTRIRLGFNRFTGEIPSGFWGLPRVYLVELVNNSFSGEIAKSIATAANLSQLILDNNRFNGTIPEEIGWLSNLGSFSASKNRFSGSLPASIVNLKQLGSLDLSSNSLYGKLPSRIDSLKKINELNLANNEFSGEIPAGIGKLPVLNYLYLSSNRFSGEIPLSLQNLKLNKLNLSYNKLTGKIPPLFAKEMYKFSFIGNPNLCANISGFCNGNPKGKGFVWLLRSLFIVSALVLLVGLVWFYSKYRTFKATRTFDKSKWTLMSFHKLGFDEFEILASLDEDNVIGTGSSGKVYKVVLANGEAVAVKKLEMGEKGYFGDDDFDSEVDTLGKIRHKNIVKLWFCCSNRDTKLLVFEFMANGSLGDLLHSNKGRLLDWPTRFKILLDSAEGLCYLHHDCVPPIVHRDVKSNNILLDGDFGARVADFGLAKAFDSTEKPKSMSVIAGSCGYIAPEYAYTLRVNEKSDIYSFGVVMLELVTRRRPVDPEFGEKDLVKWVLATIDQKGVGHVIDLSLDSCFKEEICKVLNIGILCTSPLPVNRPSMRRVVKILQEVGGEKLIAKKDGKSTPHYVENTLEH